MVLKKEDFLTEIVRDEKGEVLPIEIELEDGSGSVRMTPLSLSEIKEMRSNGKLGVIEDESKDEKTAELLARHLEDPKFTKEELLNEDPGKGAVLKVLKYAQLVQALLEISGYSVKKKQ